MLGYVWDHLISSSVTRKKPEGSYTKFIATDKPIEGHAIQECRKNDIFLTWRKPYNGIDVYGKWNYLKTLCKNVHWKIVLKEKKKGEPWSDEKCSGTEHKRKLVEQQNRR